MIRNDNAVNGAGRGDRNIIDDAIDRVSQKFEAGDERNVQIAVCKLCAKGDGMIERNWTWPTVNKWTGVEIFDAADARGFQREM